MVTQTALGSDEAGMDKTLDEQAAMHLQARRRLMKTEAFQEKMKRRAGIEGTISELVRGYGARQARYRGLTKARLQNYFIGTACNIRRWLQRIVKEIEQISPELAAT